MKRAFVLLPPLALLVAGLCMLAVAPFAWGAAATIGFSDSLPTRIAVIYAVPAILLGGVTTVAALRRITDDFEVSWYLLPFCDLVFLIAIILEFALCFRVADSHTYALLRNSSGEVTVTQSGLFASSVAPTFVFSGLVAVFAYAYCQSLSPGGTTRFDRQPGELDAVAALIEAQMRNNRPL